MGSRRKSGLLFLTELLFLACACLGAGSAHADGERIWLDAKINGKPARMFFDTGMGEIALFKPRAKSFGLRVLDSPQESISTEPLHAGEVSIREWTQECALTVWDTTFTYSMAALEVPDSLLSQSDTGDGAVGWYPVRQNIFDIDAVTLKVESLAEVPEEAASWTALHVSTFNSVLNLETRAKDGAPLRINVDTGDNSGVSLRPDLWRRWKKAHPKAPATLMANWMPALGKVVAEEEVWAEELELGDLLLRGVPVKENNAANMAHDATLGLAALKRLRLIVDGNKEIAHVQARKEPPPAYEHNRIGAVFIPPEQSKDEALVAYVIKESPAYNAGVRNGDRLLEIDGHDVTRWRTDPDQMALLDFGRPVGTKMKLALRRDGKPYWATVVMRQILGPP
jgi:hypothetical protein